MPRFVPQRQRGGPDEHTGQGGAQDALGEDEEEKEKRGRRRRTRKGRQDYGHLNVRQEDQRLLQQALGQQPHKARRGEEPLAAAVLRHGECDLRKSLSESFKFLHGALTNITFFV